MESKNLYIFADVDGVFKKYGTRYNDERQEVDEDCVANLQLLIDRLTQSNFKPYIVFNSAWNIYKPGGLMRIFLRGGLSREFLRRGIRGCTDVCSGGGRPVMRWLVKHAKVGDPYIILDDEVVDYDMLWCRLIHTNRFHGLTREDVDRACEMAANHDKPLNHHRGVAVKALVKEARRIMKETPWLNDERRFAGVAHNFELAQQALNATDFAARAFLREDV